MRTTPLVQWSEQASKFDSSVRDVAENILGYRFPEHTYRQSCLTPRLGGMGLRKVVDHAEIAFAASWTESRNTCGEKWVERADVRGEVPSQKRGSYLKDQSILRELIDGASSRRERKRLERLQLEHAGAWVAAVPSTLDGMDCVMRPQCFGVAVAIRLGLPVVKQEGRCSSCEQVFDIMGDHASCCSKTSDLVHRHNRLRNLIDKICSEGMLSPVMEKKGILGEVSGRRPGDVSVPLWAAGKGLAMDIAVTCPLLKTNITVENPCES
jgi:hypothetical protein